MIKTITAALLAAPLFATSAIAGPYVDGSVEINTTDGDSVSQSYVAIAGYEAELGESVTAYVEGGGGSGVLGTNGSSEGILRVATGVSANVTDNLAVGGRFELTEWTDSDQTDKRYSANVRYTF